MVTASLPKLTTTLNRLPQKVSERVLQFLERKYSIYGNFDGDKPYWLNPDGTLTHQPKCVLITEIV